MDIDNTADACIQAVCRCHEKHLRELKTLATQPVLSRDFSQTAEISTEYEKQWRLSDEVLVATEARDFVFTFWFFDGKYAPCL